MTRIIHFDAYLSHSDIDNTPSSSQTFSFSFYHAWNSILLKHANIKIRRHTKQKTFWRCKHNKRIRMKSRGCTALSPCTVIKPILLMESRYIFKPIYHDIVCNTKLTYIDPYNFQLSKCTHPSSRASYGASIGNCIDSIYRGPIQHNIACGTAAKVKPAFEPKNDTR